MPTQRENNQGGNRGGLPTGPQPVVIKQSNFGGGEIGPNIEPRDDAGKRRQGVQQAKNFVVTFGGTLEKRPGLQFQAESPDADRFAAPRIWQWTGARGEPDFLLHFHPGTVPTSGTDADRPAMLSIMDADGAWVPRQVPDGTLPNEIETPWLWRDIWQLENEEGASNPGLKFAQSGDVMTCTHSDYDVHQIERVPSGGVLDGPSFAKVASTDPDPVDYYTWIIAPTNFNVQQLPPTALRITDYRARARSDGFDPAYAGHVDYAVTAVTERQGESHPALAKNDGRLMDPRYNVGEQMLLIPGGVVHELNVLGIDSFDDHPGLHVRVAPDAVNGQDIEHAFPPGTPCYIRLTRGTKGLEDHVFQVREVRREEPGTSDDRARLYPVVSGVPGSSRSEYGYSGPWVVLEPAPNPRAYEGLYARRTNNEPGAAGGTVAGPLYIGENTAPEPYDPDTPLGDPGGS